MYITSITTNLNSPKDKVAFQSKELELLSKKLDTTVRRNTFSKYQTDLLIRCSRVLKSASKEFLDKQNVITAEDKGISELINNAIKIYPFSENQIDILIRGVKLLQKLVGKTKKGQSPVPSFIQKPLETRNPIQTLQSMNAALTQNINTAYNNYRKNPIAKNQQILEKLMDKAEAEFKNGNTKPVKFLFKRTDLNPNHNYINPNAIKVRIIVLKRFGATKNIAELEKYCPQAHSKKCILNSVKLESLKENKLVDNYMKLKESSTLIEAQAQEAISAIKERVKNSDKIVYRML